MSNVSRTILTIVVGCWLMPACGGSDSGSPPAGEPQGPAMFEPGPAEQPMDLGPVAGNDPGGPMAAPAGPAPSAPSGPPSMPSTPAPGPSPMTADAGTQMPGQTDMPGNDPAPSTPTVATLFWLDINGNRIYRSDENDFSDRQTLVARTNTAPDGVAVDVEGGKIYWSNMGSLLGTGGGTLQRANLDGSDVETIVPAGFARTPKQMQIDVVNGHVYWCDREGAKVWRAGMDGASPEAIVSGHGFQELVGVALDIEGRQFYFSDRIGRKILRAGFDMPAGETADTRTDIEELFVFERNAMPIDLDLDHESDMLYWTDRQLGTVHRAGKDLPAGESPSQRSDIETLVTGLRDTIGISLDLKNGKLYYSELGGSIHESGLDGSGARQIASSGSATGVAIAHLPE